MATEDYRKASYGAIAMVVQAMAGDEREVVRGRMGRALADFRSNRGVALNASAW